MPLSSSAAAVSSSIAAGRRSTQSAGTVRTLQYAPGVGPRYATRSPASSVPAPSPASITVPAASMPGTPGDAAETGSSAGIQPRRR